MLTGLIKIWLHKKLPRLNYYAEDIIHNTKDDIAATLCLTQEDIYGSIYPETRELFRDAMKNGLLNRQQILYIKNQLNEMLREYKSFYNQQHYTNEAHYIYTVMKSPALSNEDYEQLINIIERFAKERVM